MLFTLRVREVRPFVRVDGEAQSAFESTQVVAEDVRVLSGPERQMLLPARRCTLVLTLARSIVSSASFLSRSRRSIACSLAPATPPPPNLLPTRFCARSQ
jgi:hypothetical protein